MCFPLSLSSPQSWSLKLRSTILVPELKISLQQPYPSPAPPPHLQAQHGLQPLLCTTTSILVVCVLSHSVMYNSLQPHGLQPTRLLCPWDSPGKNTGVGIHSFLLRIFPTQGLNLSPALQADSLPSKLLPDPHLDPECMFAFKIFNSEILPSSHNPLTFQLALLLIQNIFNFYFCGYQLLSNSLFSQFINFLHAVFASIATVYLKAYHFHCTISAPENSPPNSFLPLGLKCVCFTSVPSLCQTSKTFAYVSTPHGLRTAGKSHLMMPICFHANLLYLITADLPTLPDKTCIHLWLVSFRDCSKSFPFSFEL